MKKNMSKEYIRFLYGDKCKVCGRKITINDYFELCRKCQPAYSAGRITGRKGIIQQIKDLINEE